MFVVFQNKYEEWLQVETDHVWVNTYSISFDAKHSGNHYVISSTNAATISDQRDPEVEVNDQ